MPRMWRLALAVVALLTVAATTTAQGPAVDRVMRKKLVVAQHILEAVVTSRWADLEARSRELEGLTSEPGWTVFKAPEYAARSDAFKKAVRMLHDAAANRDLEATPKAYIDVTLSCVACHRYMARSRIAKQ